MGVEIERKFLVRSDQWRDLAEPARFRQGYLCADAMRSVRIRVAGENAFLTIKSGAKGLARAEFEYAIPVDEAEAMLALCQGALIEKDRYTIQAGDHTWEVDAFFGDNQGLVVAEIELEHEGQAFEKPPWVGEEVSHDPRYLNANLVKCPFSSW